ncbi:MAG: uracil-DNA glycosylase family protein, partial [Cyclobacteriaceae bacterium]
MKFADHHLHFIKNLRIEVNLPAGVEVLFPFNKVEVWEINQLFYQKYYHDNFPRVMIFGINPGRLGGGVTGIPFTDPIRLANFCGIENTLEAKGELSSTFIYEMISAYGGTEKFYQRFYFTAVSPLGFIKDHKNLNYYDMPNWKSLLEKYIVQGIQTQLLFGVERHVAFCLGQGI